MPNGIELGSLVNFTQIQTHPLIQQKFTALHESACVMGCREIRNRATIGGNICNAASGAEGGSTMLIFDPIVHIAGKDGRRSMPLAEFYQATEERGKTKVGVALKPGELVTHFFLPFLPAKSNSTYIRRSRTQGMDLSSLNLALAIIDADIPENRRFRIAGGAVAPLPCRFPKVEEFLASQATLSSEVIQAAKRLIQEAANPRAGSKRASVAYKKDQIGELLEQAIHKLVNGHSCCC